MSALRVPARDTVVPVPPVSRDGLLDVLVIGAGQAGLALARRLQAAGADFLLVDGAPRVGDSWRRRWDSLQLFTPRPFARLPGLDYPPGAPRLPDKDAVADYLEGYARHFAFPLLLDSPVERLDRDRSVFRARLSGGRELRAARVAVATGPHSAPAVPRSAAGLGAGVHQLHSAAYRHAGDVPDGEVLVVGAANTGAQLAVELHRAGRRVTLSAATAPWFLPTRVLGVGLYPLLRATRLLTAPTGGRAHRFLLRRGDPVIGTELRPLLASGAVPLRPRVVAAAGDVVTFAGGGSSSVSSVLWATGYRPALDWIDVPGALDVHGHPAHRGGRSPVPGLVWLGLPWQRRMDSGIIHGVDADARKLLPALLGPPTAARAEAGR